MMNVLVWVHDHILWLALGIIPCAAAIGWGLWAGRYQPTHAGAGPVPERLWPLVGDPRAGSMQLADDQAWTPGAGHGARGEPATVVGFMAHETPGPRSITPYYTGERWVPDWREVAHEEPWLAQTRHDLAPAVLDSGPGGLAWPGPDLDVLPAPADPGRDAWRDALLLSRSAGGPESPGPDGEEPGPGAPEPVWTVAGRLVETSDEWLQRLMAAAGPGWTYAGVAA